jgi:serine/threonine protein phosphatase PrpC
MEDTLTAEDALPADTVLADRYRIDRFLETKGGARLYRAIDEVTQLSVIAMERTNRPRPRTTTLMADKEGLTPDSPWFDYFAVLRSVTYPTLVKAVDIFDHGETSFLVIEQLEGRDLGYFLTQQRPTVQTACDWMIQLCQTLHQLHRRQIVHMDLQPRYIVVSYDLQRVRLTGLHRAGQLPVEPPQDIDSPYASPEVLNGGRIDERADIYSLGVIWHQLLTGFDPAKSLHANRRRHFPDVSYFLPAVHPQINRIIRCMLEPNPAERFASVEEVKRAILDVYASLVYQVGYATDVGMVREGNEDAYLVVDQATHQIGHSDRWGLFIACDGMGGALAGEQASSMASREMAHHVLQGLGKEGMEPPAMLEAAIKKANGSIFQAAKRNPQWSGMGTTITGALLWGGTVYIGHVGDSRGYLINASGIEKITRDHSLVGRLLEMGQITPDEASVHPQRNLIYRSLGSYPTVEVDVYARSINPNDRILLCSDGLTEHVGDDDIHRIVMSQADPRQAARHLVNLANQRGGEDNITIVVFQIEEVR